MTLWEIANAAEMVRHKLAELGPIKSEADVEMVHHLRARLKELRRQAWRVNLKTVDDLARRKMDVWEEQQKRAAVKALPRSKPKPLPQARKGSGRFARPYLVERA